MTRPDPAVVLMAMGQRLRACASVLLDSPPATDPDPSRDAAVVLDAVVASIFDDPGGGRLWLLLVAAWSVYPTAEDVEEARRRLEVSSQTDFTLWLLRSSLEYAVTSGVPASELEIVDTHPVVDVHFSARSDLTSGIQRVVRETMSRWVDVHDLTLVAWTDAGGAMRRLSTSEQDRVLKTTTTPTPEESASPTPRLVVPWKVPVVLSEVPALVHSDQLAALAEHSASPLIAIGYDAIPLISPEFVSEYEHRKYVKYLAVIKRAHSVVAISESTATEFRGFNTMLAAQGLCGPTVTACPLPTAVAPPHSPPEREVVTETPTILCVGSLDRRKNQLGLIHAAEVLWREGRSFALRLIGSGGLAPNELLAGIDELREQGRPIVTEVGVSDATLADAYRSARFSVFPSLHEGFGLPVVESLSHGTPVIASALGSIIECTEDGGALLIDPRQDDSLADAMRQLLDDDELLERLRTEALARPHRTWDDYAAELWNAVTGTGAS